MSALLVRVEDRRTGEAEEHVFGSSPVRLGRNSLNDLRLVDAFVSQWHLVLQFDAGAVRCVDLGSTNGTRLNGRRLHGNEPVAVSVVDSIEVGPLCISARLTDRAPSMPRADIVRAPGAVASHEAAGTTVLTAGHGSSEGGAAGALVAARKAVDELGELYETYRRAWADMQSALERAVGEVPAIARPFVPLLARQAYPAVQGEPSFQRLAVDAGAPPLSGGELADQVAHFARSVGAVEADTACDEIPTTEILARAREVLNVFGGAFVELRKGFDEFGEELAVRTFGDETPLHCAETAQQVLSYLLKDGEGLTSGRVLHLRSAFADVMIHQVALLNGLMDGVRTLLDRLSPKTIEAEVAQEAVALGPIRLKCLPKFVCVGRWWRRYARLHSALAEEDQTLTATVFGSQFARTYAATAAGGGAGTRGSWD